MIEIALYSCERFLLSNSLRSLLWWPVTAFLSRPKAVVITGQRAGQPAYAPPRGHGSDAKMHAGATVAAKTHLAKTKLTASSLVAGNTHRAPANHQIRREEERRRNQRRLLPEDTEPASSPFYRDREGASKKRKQYAEPGDSSGTSSGSNESSTKARLRRLNSAFADGLIDSDTYKATKRALMGELVGLDTTKATTSKAQKLKVLDVF